jgi:hypothetical protein
MGVREVIEEYERNLGHIPQKMGIKNNTKKGYESLYRILMLALDQAQNGKGMERHADGERFENQPICRIGRRKGLGFTEGQIWKKILEVDNLTTIEAKIREMLSVIVYAAADIILLEEMVKDENEDKS